MHSASVYLELQESGDRLLGALIDERKARLRATANPAPARCRKRLTAARHEVERAAEHYAIALRDFRVATLAEFDTATPKSLGLPSSGQCRKRIRAVARAVSAPCRKHPGHAEDAFALSTRLSKTAVGNTPIN
jgi:hypothetical protein